MTVFYLMMHCQHILANNVISEESSDITLIARNDESVLFNDALNTFLAINVISEESLRL